MNLKSSFGKMIGLFTSLPVLNSWISVAKMSNFSNTAAAINFDKYSSDYHEQKAPFWTSKTSNEYYFEKDNTLTEKDLTDIIQYALKERGYTIKTIDPDNDYIIGKRGMHANEWSSITGIYYKINQHQKKLQVYINSKITQDFTGGWRENRAKKIGQIIEKKIDSNH